MKERQAPSETQKKFLQFFEMAFQYEQNELCELGVSATTPFLDAKTRISTPAAGHRSRSIFSIARLHLILFENFHHIFRGQKQSKKFYIFVLFFEFMKSFGGNDYIA